MPTLKCMATKAHAWFSWEECAIYLHLAYGMRDNSNQTTAYKQRVLGKHQLCRHVCHVRNICERLHRSRGGIEIRKSIEMLHLERERASERTRAFSMGETRDSPMPIYTHRTLCTDVCVRMCFLTDNGKIKYVNDIWVDTRLCTATGISVVLTSALLKQSAWRINVNVGGEMTSRSTMGNYEGLWGLFTPRKLVSQIAKHRRFVSEKLLGLCIWLVFFLGVFTHLYHFCVPIFRCEFHLRGWSASGAHLSPLIEC